MHSRVEAAVERQVGAVRRVCGLVERQLTLRRQRQGSEIVDGPEVPRVRKRRLAEFPAIEGVAVQHLAEHQLQLLQLYLLQRLPTQCLHERVQVGIEPEAGLASELIHTAI